MSAGCPPAQMPSPCLVDGLLRDRGGGSLMLCGKCRLQAPKGTGFGDIRPGHFLTIQLFSCGVLDWRFHLPEPQLCICEMGITTHPEVILRIQ